MTMGSRSVHRLRSRVCASQPCWARDHIAQTAAARRRRTTLWGPRISLATSPLSSPSDVVKVSFDMSEMVLQTRADIECEPCSLDKQDLLLSMKRRHLASTYSSKMSMRGANDILLNCIQSLVTVCHRIHQVPVRDRFKALILP